MSRREHTGRKSTAALREEEELRECRAREERSLLDLFRQISLCRSREHVDAAVTIARSLSKEGIHEHNYMLYLLFLRTNNEFVVDTLIGKRNPLLLFANIKPSWYLVHESFGLLNRFRRGELSEKCLLAILGVIQNTYKTSRYGYHVYRLTVSDVYNLGKFLDKKRDQLETVNRLILDLLLDIYQLGLTCRRRDEKEVALKANSIRMAFYDDHKELSGVIPDVLLLSSDFRERQIKPTIT
jgi:hypothetical protein